MAAPNRRPALDEETLEARSRRNEITASSARNIVRAFDRACLAYREHVMRRLAKWLINQEHQWAYDLAGPERPVMCRRRCI